METTNNQILKAVLSGSLTLLVIAIFLIAFVIGYISKKRKLVLENELQKQQFTQTLLEAQIEIQEETLKSISQEIHDNIGQILALTKFTLSNINETNQAETQEKILTAKILVNKAVIDLKDLSNIFNYDKANAIGLVESIKNQIEIINKNSIASDLQITGNVVYFDNKIELILFRIVQECLQNTIKHAKANTVNVIIEFIEKNCYITIKDDGVGFDITEVKNKGIGIKNMYSRIKLINGTLVINSNQQGTCVSLNVPTTA